MTRCMLLAVSLALLLAGEAIAQQATVTIDFWAMPIYKDGVGRWHTANEPADLSIEWPGGKMDAGRAKRKATGGTGEIPETPVRGVVFRAVDACELHGTFSDGSTLTMKLPREAVRFSHLERQGLRIKAVMVAVAIDCPTTITRGREVWAGIITIPSCEAHSVNGRMRVADAVQCKGPLTKIK